MSAEVRLRQLQQLVLDPSFLGLEPLLDLLLGVHQELGASHLAQDKYVADFLQWGEYGQEAWVGARQRWVCRAGTGCGGPERRGLPAGTLDPTLPWRGRLGSVEASHDSASAGWGGHSLLPSL